jgi:hypothetical protein
LIFIITTKGAGVSGHPSHGNRRAQSLLSQEKPSPHHQGKNHREKNLEKNTAPARNVTCKGSGTITVKQIAPRMAVLAMKQRQSTAEESNA